MALRQKWTRLDQLLFEYMQMNIAALRMQCEVAGEKEYLQKLSAKELGDLHEIFADRALVILRAAADGRDAEGV